MTALPIQSIDAELEAAHQEQLGLQLPEAATSLRITYVRPIKVHPDPEQPRKEADAELRASIRESGILEPISIRHADPRDGACADCGRSWHEIAGAGEYILVTGERRWRGAREVMETIPAIIRDDLSARAGERRITQLTENTAKKPLTAVEEAIALEKIRAEEPSLSITRLGMRTGLPRQVVSDRLAALRHPRFRPLFVAGVLSSSQAVEAARFAEYSETDHDRAWAKLLAMHPGVTVEEIFSGLDVRDFRAALDVAYQVSARAEGQLVVEVPMACARCGCTEERACEGGCHWVGVDVPICSACIRDDEEVRQEPCAHCVGTGERNEGEICEPCQGSGSVEVLAQRPPSISAMRAEQREDDARDAAVTAPDPADAIVQHAPRVGEEGKGTEPPARGEAVERESAPGGAWGTSSSAPTPGAAAPAQPATVLVVKHSAEGKSTDPVQLIQPPLPGLFAALAPLLAGRGVIVSIRPLEANRFHVIVMPGAAEGKPGLAPLVARGTIEELDTELAGAIAAYIAAGPAELPPSPAAARAKEASASVAKKRSKVKAAATKSSSKKPAAKKSTTKKAPARKAAPAKKPASSTAKRRGKAASEAAPQDANTQEARAVEPVEEGQARVEAATNAVSGEAVTGANETLGDVGGEQSGSSTGPSDTAPSNDEVQPYYRAYMNSQGFTDRAALVARDVNNVPFMAWLNGQQSDFAAIAGAPERSRWGEGERLAFAAWLDGRWNVPSTTTTED